MRCISALNIPKPSARWITAAALAAGMASALSPPARADALTMTGQLVETHAHQLDGTELDETYALRRGAQLTPLAGDQPEALVGQDVAVTDASAQAAGIQGTARAAGLSRRVFASESGPISVLAVVISTPDLTQSITVDQARSQIFTAPDSVAALYAQQSEGSVQLTGLNGSPSGDVVSAAISVPMGACAINDVSNATDASLAASGITVGSYAHVIYVLPHTSNCEWAGLGQMPGKRTWVNGTVATGVVGHELGHNLGAHHANLLRCTANGVAVTLSSTCSSQEYGDPFDVMGVAGARLMSSWHRTQIGEESSAEQVTARSSQTVSVTSSDLAGPGTKLLLIPRKLPGQAIASYLAIELRSSAGPFDAWSTPFSAVTQGVSIRLVPQLAVIQQSNLLDTNPQTPSPLDAPLAPGTTFSDSSYGITLSTGPVVNGHVDVTVTMPTVVDDVAPSAVSRLAMGRATDRVSLAWGAATDDDAVDHYEILRGGALIGTTPGLSFDDTDPAQAAGGRYGVRAVDRSGNTGPASEVMVAALPRKLTPTPTPAPTPTPTTPPGPGPSDGAAPLGDLKLLHWNSHRRGRQLVWTMTFRAANADEIAAYSGGRTVGRAYAARVTVRIVVPRGARRRVKVVASTDTEESTSTWTLRS